MRRCVKDCVLLKLSALSIRALYVLARVSEVSEEGIRLSTFRLSLLSSDHPRVQVAVACLTGFRQRHNAVLVLAYSHVRICDRIVAQTKLACGFHTGNQRGLRIRFPPV